jgi:hypothetical protein
MITKKLISSVKGFAYQEIDKYGAPSKFQVDFTNDKGQLLAEKLNADRNIVLLGTLLMDCKLGQAYKEGRLKDHIELSGQKANELLFGDRQITDKEKAVILGCIKQHHGADKFLSLEAEICCNADCYKFASVKGVVGSIKNMRDMPIDDLVKLFQDKADEKWKALSLDICIQELKPEYNAIKVFLSSYKG